MSFETISIAFARWIGSDVSTKELSFILSDSTPFKLAEYDLLIDAEFTKLKYRGNAI
jgi:hypothetical protein